MIERSVSDILRKYASWFPVVSVTGPRQSGKSTLVQSVFSDYSYVNLELPGDLEAANADPLGFIRSHPAPLIIDEAQLAPELFNVIQVESDRAGTPGQYILSGSQNYLLRRQITQSLAGRVGILTLPPLSFRELACAGKAPKADDYLVRGGYPRLYNIENRHNSADSRYWGFVPEDHIVGKPILIWLSLDKDRGWFDGHVRWNRLFRLVDHIK